MKTKLIILAAAAAAILYSCSSDRDEEVRKDAIESVKNAKTKENFKLNNSGMQAREGEAQATSDTIKIRSLNGPLSEDPDTNINPDDPSEGGDPKNVPPRK
ncbi:hypothetical protein [uncultured Chryseobacterium sp.]|uniref:hypothetical protein n=1 Tax=uncultured Chryseobacterium sp. TaxID=259322 RepID=UPI0025892456|nr:hypothetical protein [uncultured Chryseobacterium sp.]